MFSNNGPIMILRGHHLSHNQDVWLLQVPGLDDSNGSKDLDLHPARPPKSHPFSAMLCVHACESPRRSAGAVVFTCSRSLAIAPFSLLAVALWKMGS